MAKTSIQKSIFWVPKSKQVGTKMGSGAPWVASRVVFSVTTFPRTFPRTFYWQLEPQLGSQNGAKMAKKSIQKSIIVLMPLEIDLWVDYAGFCCQNRAMLATKWDQNPMLTSKVHFSNYHASENPNLFDHFGGHFCGHF